jgi:peptide/nickel transport system ATP-binding protein
VSSIDAPLLSVRDLSVSFVTDGGVLRAVDGASFDVPKGSSVALVGESGCGKSVTAQAILRLIPSPPGSITGGDVELEGRSLFSLSERDMRAVRGGRIGVVFQEPMSSLNPVYSVGWQIAEAIRMHERAPRREVHARVLALLRRVRMPNPELHAESYPHELSGGMRQRVLIAIALASNPTLLIADEPTTALDTTIQAQILELLRELRESQGMSLLLIAHDFGVVAEYAAEIVVMYAGAVVEMGPTATLLRAPMHPYTRALLRSVPPARAYRVRGERGRKLPTIEGSAPDLREASPTSCKFEARCPEAFDRCRAEAPPLYPSLDGAAVRCFLADPTSPRVSAPFMLETELAPASRPPPTDPDPPAAEAPVGEGGPS